MKAEIVMAGLQRGADAAGGLVTGDKRGDDLAAGRALKFRQSEEPGQDRHRRVARHCHIDVVVIERMRCGTIDECGRQRRQPDAVADDARLGRVAGLRHLVEQNPNERIRRPGERHAEIVEDALPGELAHRFGELTVIERRRLVRQSPCQVRSVHFFLRSSLDHRPAKRGLRFSLKARTPSRRSSVGTIRL